MPKLSTKNLGPLSSKHVLLDKANSTVLIATAISAAIVVFCLFAGKALVDKIGYQNDVIGKRKDANNQLQKNIESVNSLVLSYSAFNDTPESVIGTPDKNSKIVLDALPSKYDFPALATSLDGIVTGAGMTVESITGVDEEVTATQSSITPQPVTVTFKLNARGSYDAAQALIRDLQRSIRPMKINTVKLEVQESNLIGISIEGETYYQPSTEIGIQNLKVNEEGELVEPQSSSQPPSGSVEQ